VGELAGRFSAERGKKQDGLMRDLTRWRNGRKIALSETNVEVRMQITPPGQSLVADRLGIGD
jgi:hypothetical protein